MNLSRAALFSKASHVFARTGLWQTAVTALAMAGPLRRLPQDAVGRLSYSLLMMPDRTRARDIHARLVKQNFGQTPEIDLSLGTMAQRLGDLELAAFLYRQVESRKDRAAMVASAMVRQAQGILDDGLSRELAAAIDALALPASGRVLIVPVGSSYLELFGLWHEQAAKHVRGDLVVLALDPNAAQVLRSIADCKVIDLSSYFVFDAKGKIDPYCRSLLWILRTYVLRELASKGHTTVSLDLDAVLLDNLDTLLAKFPVTDIVVQQDYSIPMDVARKLGFILCCGFMVLYPTEATRNFLDRYARRTAEEMDDQLAINHQIAKEGLSDRKEAPEYSSFRADGVQIVCPDKALVSRDIEYGTVIRHFQQRGETIQQLRQKMGL